jgi:hypothetical protein
LFHTVDPESACKPALESFPRFGAAQEGAHTSDSSPFQKQRHTGAGSFVRSTAIENDLSVSWNLVAARGEFFGGNSDGARYGVEVFRKPAAKVDDKKLLASIQPVLQFLGCDSGYVQLLKETAALNIFPADPQ